MAIPRSSALRSHEQSRVPSLARGCVVPRTQSVQWTPPTPAAGCCAFVSLYASVDGLPIPVNGSPALGSASSITCRPCYPGRDHAPLPLFQHASSDLPLLTTGSASPIRLRGYSWVHLALRPATLLQWKLTTPCCHDAASSRYQGARTIPWTGLQPARYTAVTANGQFFTL